MSEDKEKGAGAPPPALPCLFYPIVHDHELIHLSLLLTMSSDTASTTETPSALDGFEQRLRQRAAAVKADPLQTVPVQADHQPRGFIPNTPLSVALISFLLGSLFAFGLLLFSTNGFGLFWWSTSQLGFFLAAWSAFHWGEFAVTAGWNREKCSVDCKTAPFHANASRC